MLFPPGTPLRASRSPPSPAPTARPPPRAWWGTSSSSPATTSGMATTDGVYIDGVLTVQRRHDRPVASQLVLRDPHGRRGGAGDGARRHRALRPRLAAVQRRRGAQRRLRPPGPGRGRDLDDLAWSSGWSSRWRRTSACSTPTTSGWRAWPSTARASRSTSRMDRKQRAGAPARPRARQGGGAGGGAERPHARALRGRGADPAALGAPDPGDARGAGRSTTSRTPCSPRRSPTRWGSASRTSARGCAPSPPTSSRRPGRLNFYDEHPSGCSSTTPTTRTAWRRWRGPSASWRSHGRRIGVLAAPGDRRDEDIRATGAAAAPAFDLILLREDDDLRGRAPGEMGELLRAGLLAAGFPAERIVPEVYGEEEAVRRALEMAGAGDLVVIFGDDVHEVWEQITAFRPRPPIRKQRLAGRGRRRLVGRHELRVPPPQVLVPHPLAAHHRAVGEGEGVEVEVGRGALRTRRRSPRRPPGSARRSAGGRPRRRRGRRAARRARRAPAPGRSRPPAPAWCPSRSRSARCGGRRPGARCCRGSSAGCAGWRTGASARRSRGAAPRRGRRRRPAPDSAAPPPRSSRRAPTAPSSPGRTRR